MGNYHSLFTAIDGTVYGVKNNSLGIINPDYSFVVLQAGINSDPSTGVEQLSYVQVGPTIYFSSPSAAGKIVDSIVVPWGPEQDIWLSPVVNPTATLPEIRGRLIGKPPMAKWLTYSNGRIYLSQGSVVWGTDLYLYDSVDKTRNFLQFEGEVTMLGAVGDGFYVGTTEGLWFLAGTLTGKISAQGALSGGMARKKIMDSGVIPGSMVEVPAELANPPQVDRGSDTPLKVSIMFMTDKGFCVGSDGGEAYNLTESKMVFPHMDRAVALYRRQDGVNQYIAVSDSGGTPSSNTRIGDYVDAELIRAGNWASATDGVTIGDRLDVTVI